MAKLNILLYSKEKTQKITYEDTNETITTDIEQTFMHKCGTEANGNGWNQIIVCQKTRDSLKALEAKYDAETRKSIRKLYGFIAKLTDGDIFYYINEDKATIVDRKTAIDCINAANNGIKDIKRVNLNSLIYYSKLDHMFEYLSFGFDGIEISVGEKEKGLRICRFCGKKEPDISFDKIAHAVQDALGNKLLFCSEECDTCNHRLAPIEDNFRKLMDFRRAMFHIPRKGTNKTPKVVGDNFIIKADEKGLPILYLIEEKLPTDVDKTKPFMHRLELKNLITNEGIYKALCKFVINLLPAQYLSHFENTIKWITPNTNWVPDTCPSILLTQLSTTKVVYKQPVVDIMINNKNHLKNSPYCTAIIWIYDIAYMFCIPFVDIDAGQYKYDKNLKEHWTLMSDLFDIQNWHEQNTSDYCPSKPWVEYMVQPSQENIFILPKFNPVFEECIAQKQKQKEVDIPEFNEAGITINEIKKAKFTSHYTGKISDEDLRDVTQRICGPSYILYPEKKQMQIQMKGDVYDTSNKTLFFSFEFDIIISIDSFWTYIPMQYDDNGNLISFTLHYALRDYLYKFALSNAEQRLVPQRKNTPFIKCTLNQLLHSNRILEYIVYRIPIKDQYTYIYDKELRS